MDMHGVKVVDYVAQSAEKDAGYAIKRLNAPTTTVDNIIFTMNCQSNETFMARVNDIRKQYEANAVLVDKMYDDTLRQARVEFENKLSDLCLQYNRDISKLRLKYVTDSSMVSTNYFEEIQKLLEPMMTLD